MRKKISTLFLTMLITASIGVTAMAEDKEYKLSAIDLIVTVDEDLNALMRNVSESSPELELLDTDAVNMLNYYIRNNIYLDVFPDDLSYEILVTSVPLADKNNAGFDTLDHTALEEYMERLKEQTAANDNTELLYMDLFENDTTKYIHTGTHYNVQAPSEKVSVYTERYYTVMNGYNYYYTLQTNNLEIDSELSALLTDMVNSAQYTEVKGSLSDSGMFNELYEMFIGFGLTVLILGTILFMITRKPKRS